MSGSRHLRLDFRRNGGDLVDFPFTSCFLQGNANSRTYTYLNRFGGSQQGRFTMKSGF